MKHSNQNQNSTNITYTNNGSIVEGMIDLRGAGETMNEETLCRLMKIDPSQFRITKARISNWTAQKKGGEIDPNMYAIRATLERTNDSALTKEEILREMVKIQEKAEIKNDRVPEMHGTGNPQLAVFSIADLHLGKLAYHGDRAIYNISIAKNIVHHAVYDFINHVKRNQMQLSQIVFLWCNDFFNSDNALDASPATTKGTPQENEKWHIMVAEGIELLTWCVKTLVESLHVPVHTPYLASTNHDRDNAYWAAQCLRVRFEDCPFVTVDLEPMERKAFVFGENTLLFTHGTEKAKTNWSQIFAYETQGIKRKTLYNEILAAHLHTETVTEDMNGLVFRRLSSPTEADSWHRQNGFVGNRKTVQSFFYDSKYGNTDVHVFNTESIRNKRRKH